VLVILKKDNKAILQHHKQNDIQLRHITLQHSTYVFFGSKINSLQILYQNSLKVYSMYVMSVDNCKLLDADSLALSRDPLRFNDV